MSVYSSGQLTGPGGSVAWRLTGPAALASVAAFNTALQAALRPVVQQTAQRLKAQAQSAYAGTRIAPLFGYRTNVTGTRAQLTLFNTSPIFPFVEYDTKPHKIRARNAPYLVFQIGGRWVRVKEVNHPGTKGRYAVAKLFQEAEAGFRAALVQAAKGVLTRA